MSEVRHLCFRLTAFVAKVLSQSREFGLKDDPSNVVCSAVKWLATKQQQNGAFTPEYTALYYYAAMVCTSMFFVLE